MALFFIEFRLKRTFFFRIKIFQKRLPRYKPKLGLKDLIKISLFVISEIQKPKKISEIQKTKNKPKLLCKKN